MTAGTSHIGILTVANDDWPAARCVEAIVALLEVRAAI